MHTQDEEPKERLVHVSELIEQNVRPVDIVKATGVSRSEVMAAFRWTKILQWRGYYKSKYGPKDNAPAPESSAGQEAADKETVSAQ